MVNWKSWRRRLFVYGGLYLLVAVVMVFGGCADKLILFPQTGDYSSIGNERRVLKLEGADLEIWTARPSDRSEPKAFLLSFNGNADRAESSVIAESHFWGAHPIGVWSVNYPGYGGSTGPAKLSKLAPAGLAAYDELKKIAGDRPIFVSGNSLGSTVAMHIAANRPVAGVIAMNPPPLRNLIMGRFGWWNLWLISTPVALGVPQDLNSLINARKATAPALFILSEIDEIVPVKYQRKVFDAYAGPKRHIVLTGGHNDPLTPEGERNLREELDRLWRQVIVNATTGESGSTTSPARD